MPGSDLSLLIDAARAAGALALSFDRDTLETWEKPNQQGPVSEADLATDTLLRQTLLYQRPEYGWLSEETEINQERLMREHTFIVDPIDGTRAFIRGSDYWSVSLAVAKRGVIVAAVVYLPALDALYCAQLGRGASLNGARLTVATPGCETPTILAAQRAMKPHLWPGGVPEAEVIFIPSIAYRMSLVAGGKYDAALTLGPTWEWDVAAGALIIGEAGGALTQADGSPPMFNQVDPRLHGMIGAHPAYHKTLLAGLNQG